MDTVKNVNGMWGVGKGGRETWGAAGKKHDYEGGKPKIMDLIIVGP